MREKIPEILVKLENKDYQTDHQEELKIARETIDQNMIEQASIYGWYGVLSAMLDEVVGTKKLELRVLEAKLYKEHKENLSKVPGSRVTDKAIDAEVATDKRYMTMVVELNDAKKNKAIFDAIVRAFEHRKEMLINLGAKFRKEMDGDIVIKK